MNLTGDKDKDVRQAYDMFYGLRDLLTAIKGNYGVDLSPDLSHGLLQNSGRTLEMGENWLACLPITVAGRARVTSKKEGAFDTCSEFIEVFDHKAKSPRLFIKDLRMQMYKGVKSTYKALDGKKVRVTIDVVEDKK